MAGAVSRLQTGDCSLDKSQDRRDEEEHHSSDRPCPSSRGSHPDHASESGEIENYEGDNDPLGVTPVDSKVMAPITIPAAIETNSEPESCLNENR